MASKPISSNPLDVLQSMVSMVLVQTGQVFQDPAKCAPKNLNHTNIQMNEVIPVALSRFHSNLDEIEIEIRRAKAVFIRDLKASRAKKLQQQLAAAPKVSNSATSEGGNAAQNTTTPQHSADPKAPDARLSAAKAAGNSTATPKMNSLSIDTTTTGGKGEDVAGAGKQGAKQVPPPPPSSSGVLRDTPIDQTPATAGMDKIDFDSMFNDPEADAEGEAAAGGAGQINFDLDFQTDGNDDSNPLAQADFGLDSAVPDDGAANVVEAAAAGTAGEAETDEFSSLMPEMGNFEPIGGEERNALQEQQREDAGDVGLEGTAGVDVSMDGDALLDTSNLDDLFQNDEEFEIGMADMDELFSADPKG